MRETLDSARLEKLGFERDKGGLWQREEKSTANAEWLPAGSPISRVSLCAPGSEEGHGKWALIVDVLSGDSSYTVLELRFATFAAMLTAILQGAKP